MSEVRPTSDGSSESQPPRVEALTGGLPPEALLDLLGDGLIVLDGSWRFTYLNAVAEQVLGRGRGELLGRELWAEMPFLEGSAFGEAYRRAMAESVTVTLEQFHARRSAWFEVRAVPRSGHLVVLFRDVTARRQSEEARERSAARLALLQEVTAKLSAAASAEEVVALLARGAKEAVGADGISVGLATEEGHALRLVGSEGFSSELVRKYEHLPVEAELPITRAFRTGEPQWLGSPKDFEERYPHVAADVLASPSKAFACLCLRAKDTPLGAISFAFSQPRTYDEADRGFMLALAHQGALALDRARLFDREQAARAEAESQRARLHTLVMEAPAAVCLMRGPEHIVELDNPPHRALQHGRDLTGVSMRQAQPRFGAFGLLEVLDRVYTRGEPFVIREHPVRVAAQDGTVEERFFNFSYRPLHSGTGRVEGVAFFAYDVTSHVRARKELEVLARRLRFLSEASTLLVGSLDYTTTLESLTRLVVPELADWCAVYMLTEDGQAELLAVAHQDPSRVELARQVMRLQPVDLSAPGGVGKVLRTGQPEWTPVVPVEALVAAARTPEAVPLVRALGLCSYMCVPLMARGRVLGCLTLAQAESDRHYTEADLRLAEELARRAALSVENARLYREAQQAIRLRDEFLSVASHELKTPLTSLRLQLSLIERLMGAEARERLDNKLEVARRQVDRLASLVNMLLDVGRIATGRITLELAEVDLTRAVQEALERLREVFEQAGCTVTLHAEGPVVGLWDALRLDQVIVNLLTNAAKYGQGKPITVSVESTPHHARLIVRDEGIGIAPEDLSRLFGRFERAVSVRHYGGLGLGLYISREIIEALGGRVLVESLPDQGATFTVELPRGGSGR